MKIAQVIVDVPAAPINQTFDYLIPKSLEPILQKGMRVVIPFGPRKITGFVMDIVSKSTLDSLREIIDVLDITPVLTDELLALGKWLADQTLCFYITAYQAMLPQVLKSTYEKEIVKTTEDPLPSSLVPLFAKTDVVPFDALSSHEIPYEHLRKAVDAGQVDIHYQVKSNITKKFETYITPSLTKEDLTEFIEALPGNAIRQKEIAEYFLLHRKPIKQSKLFQTLNIARPHIKTLLDKGVLEEEKREIYRDPYEGRDFKRTTPLILTKEQTNALQMIEKNIRNKSHDVVLVHGVTGSGKTEIYLQAIDQVLAKGEEAIVLVPEISLTPQMVRRFKGRFGEKVAVLHSALSAGEKYDEWRKIHRKEVQVVVGARSAVFAPFENLGIIIIDEEHETTYKQEEQPRYHARDVAIFRGEHHSCPIVLGSATPTLESYARAQKDVYKLATLNKRINEQALPAVEIIDMRAELHAGNRSMFSRRLIEQIKARIERDEQIVLLLNRRGYSTFVMCRDCGHVEECPHCDIALTYHKNGQRLKCHYCTYEVAMPTLCPVCQSEKIRYFGTGTQRVEESLREEIPEISIIRMDVDTTRRKGAHERLLGKFGDQEADILLGTQMIAKGLDFPNVTLVGVLAADSMLHLPDFRSSERTFQLLTQVSGRAGRHELPGEVIVQSYTPDHYSVELASVYDFQTFYKEEMKIRRTFNYPPYVFLVLITVSHEEQGYAHRTTQRISQLLANHVGDATIILGPTPSPIPRLKNRYRYHCMIKYKREGKLRPLLQKILNKYSERIQKDSLQIVVDFQPYQFM